MQPADATRPLGTPTPEQLLHRLEWQVIRRLDGILQGNYRTVFRGAGTWTSSTSASTSRGTTSGTSTGT